MKLERRGKYPGIKVHFDPEECQQICDRLEWLSIYHPDNQIKPLRKLRKLIKRAIDDDPTLFDDRTEDEIKKELKIERDKSTARLKLMNAGGKWND